MHRLTVQNIFSNGFMDCECLMKKYNIITYRLKQNTKPCDVSDAIEALLEKHSAFFSECLFRVGVMICEYEFDGKLHSNRNRNAVNTLLRRYPALKDYYKYKKREKDGTDIREDVCIDNFSDEDFLYRGEIKYDLIRDIINKVPKPYGVSDLELIYNGISFGKRDAESEKIKPSTSGFDAPVGNYIWYSHTSYGYEKNSVILFATDDEKLENMRKIFFELAEMLPGKYEGTEYHS